VTYEVIFVSNGSTDGSERLLENAARDFPGKFRWFRIDPTGGPSAPRNVGIRAARGDIVIILDDDIVPEEDLAQSYADFHQKFPEPHQAAIGEAYVPEDLLRDPMSRFHAFPYDEIRSGAGLNYLYFWTCNVSFKRDFMLGSEMFDETFLYYEDILCGYHLQAKGMELRFCPAARGRHLHQMTPAGLSSKGLFLGRWLQPLFERIPDPALKMRMGIVSRDLPPAVQARRILGRLIYQAIDNPALMAVLRGLGGTASRRSKLTDFYYGLIFRRYRLRGYNEAVRRAKAGQRLNLTKVNSVLADRGDR
jgi:glycosyltransferase involved in cell wall biosynthesis